MPNWKPATVSPEDSRCVMMRFDYDGQRDSVGFYWNAEGLWYMQHGSKRRTNAVHPVLWRELEPHEWTELEPPPPVEE